MSREQTQCNGCRHALLDALERRRTVQLQRCVMWCLVLMCLSHVVFIGKSVDVRHKRGHIHHQRLHTDMHPMLVHVTTSQTLYWLMSFSQAVSYLHVSGKSNGCTSIHTTPHETTSRPITTSHDITHSASTTASLVYARSKCCSVLRMPNSVAMLSYLTRHSISISNT